jgi:transposase-like protein
VAVTDKQSKVRRVLAERFERNCERLRLVASLLDGASMREVCQEFGISCKTGYKICARHNGQAVEALCDRSERPARRANPQRVQRRAVARGVGPARPIGFRRGLAECRRPKKLASSSGGFRPGKSSMRGLLPVSS